MKILGIIPARSGSKGLKNKNILSINNKPLIAWSILASKRSNVLTKIIVSTDSKKIAKISMKYGAEVPFIRPKKFSGDNSKSSDVIIHAINFYKKLNIYFDYVMLIEPTSPLRESNDIKYCVNLVKRKNLNTLVSISKIRSQHPRFAYKLSSNSKLKPLVPKKNLSPRRQDVEKLYYLDGSIYISRINSFLKKKTFYHKNTSGIVMPDWKAIEVDNLLDLKLSEYIMKNKRKFKNG